MAPVVLPQKNKVWINQDGLIEVDVVGDQTPDTVRQMSDEVMILAGELRLQGKEVFVLDDISRMSLKQPPAVAREVGAQAKRIQFTRLALLGSGNALLRYGTNFIIRGLGMPKTMKYFTDRPTAERWLREG